jgi:serine/threonine-protein kinase
METSVTEPTDAAPTDAGVAGARVHEALPSYEIGGELGRGAMGVVLAARHRQLERSVAIKQLPPAFAADEEVRRRFGAEARTLAALAHPHIVPVYDYVEQESVCLLVMETLPGGTLWDRFTSQGLTMPTACAAVIATCSGLHFAHEKGVLHRDIKPENLMFAADETLKVTDFGIAQVFSGDETVTTVSGAIIGTPAYMAPEQATGLALGPAADVYAAGTVLYELLSGTLPFSLDGEPLEVLERRATEEPVPLDEAAPNVPAPLVAVTMRALRRNPAERYDSAEDFGVAVGKAATEAFGAGWLGRADLTLLATGPLAAAAGPAIAPDADTTPDAATAPLAGRAGAGTVVTGESAPDASARVRATATPRAGGAAIAELRPEDLVRVDDLISPPKAPVIPLVAAGLLAIAVLATALVGFGEPERTGALRPGVVSVAGVDLGTDDVVHADLGDPVPVEITELPRQAADAQYAQIGFSAGGVGLGSSRSAPLTRAGDGVTGEVDAARVRILSSGELTAEFRLLDENKRILLRDEFVLDPKQPFFLAVNGVAALLLILFVGAYGLSLVQPLRRGHSRRSAYPGMAFLGVVAGWATVLLTWSLGAPEPGPATFVAAAVLGGACFAFAARATIVLGRRRRLRTAEVRAGADWESATADDDGRHVTQRSSA